MNKFDHAISFSFTLKSNNEEPSGQEVLQALRKAINNPELNDDNIFDSTEIFDSFENE